MSIGAVLSLAACGRHTVADERAAGSAGPPGSSKGAPSRAADTDPLESSPSAPPCVDGTRLTEGQGDAAMGLRVLTLTLTNCGSQVRRLDGYPTVRLLDKDGDPLEVEIDRGAQKVTIAVKDPGAKPVTLLPGHSARFDLVWRNTYTDISRPPENGATAVVTPAPGSKAQRVTPTSGPFDLGSTGRLGITAWEEDPDSAPRTGSPGTPAASPSR
jgi:Protein of unknown function (DUF4232)